MGIKANFSASDIRAYMITRVDDLTIAMLQAYKDACKDMVTRAKQTNTYKDQTHALRSSIGYVLYYKGNEVANYFESAGGEAGGEGVESGLNFARETAMPYSGKTIVAVVVAGMNYALYVESKGMDVITGSSRQFITDLQAGISDVKQALAQHVIEKFDL
jgi:hypothetical protein